MFIVLGASGHVGSEVANALLAAGEPVTTVLHDPSEAEAWTARGAKTAVVDVLDTDALRAVLQTGSRAFLLNPPGDVAGDTDAAETATAQSIVAALDGAGLDKVVLESTSGAVEGVRIGDSSVLFDFEQALRAQGTPYAIQRAAYYMSNWDLQLAEAKAGTLTTMLPADFEMPMVAPVDLGQAAARHLRSPLLDARTYAVEGPERYTPRQVADTFAEALGRPVKLVVVPRDEWIDAYRKQGFSAAAADAYARMTATAIEGQMEPADPAEQGATTLQAYIGALVSGDGA